MMQLQGQSFGRLFVTSFSHKTPRSRAYWNCRCSCGQNKTIIQDALVGGTTKSCGCLSAELTAERNRAVHLIHGMSKTRLYHVYSTMQQRCENPNNRYFKHYGARGITVCPEWSTFAGFLKDMGPSFVAGLTLDRENNNLGYSKANCRWVTQKVQCRNKRNNVMATHDGKTQTIAAWAEETGLPYSTLHNRAVHGKTIFPAKALEDGLFALKSGEEIL